MVEPFCARAAAVGTGLDAVYLYLAFAALRRLFKRNGDARLNVVAAPRGVGVGASAAEAAEPSAASEEAAENIT